MLQDLVIVVRQLLVSPRLGLLSFLEAAYPVLELAYGQVVLDYQVAEGLLGCGVVESKQYLGMSHAQQADLQVVLDLCR